MRRGCETFVVREGYEGLVRGNKEAVAQSRPVPIPEKIELAHPEANPNVLHNLRFGFGKLLKNGEGDIETHADPNVKTLKGRYIVRVGWDDVRGWMGEVRIDSHVTKTPCSPKSF